MAKDVKSFRVHGTISAPATAFKDNGDINTGAIKDYVDFMVKKQVDGVFILGTLGEGVSLTVSERKDVAAAWVEYSKDKLSTVIVQVGTSNLRDSIELAKHAESTKADAIACLAPFYHRPEDEDSAIDYLAKVAEAAPNTPFYYYCINFMTGVYLPPVKVLEKGVERIPTLRGAKISSKDLPDLQACTVACGGMLDIMIGTDEQFLTGLALGVRTPVLNGYICPLFKRLKAAFDKGDMETARQEQHRAKKVMDLRTKYVGGPAMTKAIMKCHGLDLGPVRLPLRSLPDDRLAELTKDLKEIGLLS